MYFPPQWHNQTTGDLRSSSYSGKEMGDKSEEIMFADRVTVSY